MVALSMSLFKRYKLKLSPEVTPGVCPHCEEVSDFVSIVNDYYKCLTCGTNVEQKINGKRPGRHAKSYSKRIPRRKKSRGQG